eukprot:7685780-Pyramimonas_sp.AAC.1
MRRRKRGYIPTNVCAPSDVYVNLKSRVMLPTLPCTSSYLRGNGYDDVHGSITRACNLEGCYLRGLLHAEAIVSCLRLQTLALRRKRVEPR